jgi:hypothetical protein
MTETELQEAEKKLWSKVKPGMPDECWEYPAKSGNYGSVRITGRENLGAPTESSGNFCLARSQQACLSVITATTDDVLTRPIYF